MEAWTTHNWPCIKKLLRLDPEDSLSFPYNIYIHMYECMSTAALYHFKDGIKFLRESKERYYITV